MIADRVRRTEPVRLRSESHACPSVHPTSKALVTTSDALVTTSKALVTNSFLLLLVRHLFLVANIVSSSCLPLGRCKDRGKGWPFVRWSLASRR